MPSSGISSGSLSQIYWYKTSIFYVFALRIVHVLLPSYSFEQYEGKRRAHSSCGLTAVTDLPLGPGDRAAKPFLPGWVLKTSSKCTCFIKQVHLELLFCTIFW